MIGMSMVIPFLPLFVKDLGITEPAALKRWSGLVASGVFVTAFIATPLWGWLGDKVGKKKMVLRAIFGLALSQLLIGLSQNVEQLFIFRMVQGALSGFIAAALALVSANTPKERSGYALGFLASSTAAGNVLGPVIGGLLADSFGYRNVFFITAVMCAVSGFLVLFFVREINKEKSNHNVLENYAFVFSNSGVKYSMIVLIITAASISMVQPMFALFIESRAGGILYIATLTGAVFSVMGIFQVISSAWWGKRNDRKGIKVNLTYSLIGAGFSYAAHVIVPGLWFLLPIRALLGFFAGGVLPSLYSFISNNTPASRKGGVLGIAAAFTQFGHMLGPVSSGYIASFTSIEFIFILSGMFLAASSVIVFYKLKMKEHITEKDKNEILKAETIIES
jgi:DHA1 family multidrug resistance protein-like MFS transporter